MTLLYVPYMIDRPVRRYFLAALLASAATLVLWLLRDELTQANFSLVYLLVVLVNAVYQGTGPSLFAALICFLSFNFFLVKPLYTFLVSDPRDFLDLSIFLAAATLTGQLASDARKQTRSAQQRAYELNILYELASAFNQLTDTNSVYSTLKRVLHEHLDIRQSDILPYTAETLASTDKTILYLLLRAGETIYGILRVTFDKPPSPSLLRLVTTCALQASMALQRIDLAQRAHQSKTFEEADRLKTALLHAVSHDLRTPITIIKTSASNLLNFHDTLAESDRIEMTKTIENETDQLNKMVGNLLDISRLQAGALQINLEWNSLEEVAGDVAARSWQVTHEERVAIHFPNEMPLVRFDYGLILQAISNLVENSLRYEPAGSPVEICGSIHTGEVRVAIANHGPNIPPEERDVIMEPFYHGEGGNIGLGLAIAKGIVEAHRGRLWIEDTPGGGATFVFSLPVTPEAANKIDENFGG
jgi:two-component system, OmpR family, sensor histidine kinase KdpD